MEPATHSEITEKNGIGGIGRSRTDSAIKLAEEFSASIPNLKSADDYLLGVERLQEIERLCGATYEERALDYIERAAGGKERCWIGSAMVGMNSERAWRLRDELLNEKLSGPVLEGLAGMTCSRSWELREAHLATRGSSVVQSLIGLACDRSFALREELVAPSIKDGYFGFLAWSVAGQDNQKAWIFRERLQENPVHPAHPTQKLDRQYLGRGLACVDSDRAWDLREKLLAAGTPGGWILEGLAGMECERAWNMRERFRQKGSGYDYISLSLSLLDTERAWKMRDDMINCPIKKTTSHRGLTDFYLLNGLAGCDSERAWNLREDGLARNMNRRALIPGAHGDWLIAAHAIAQAEQREANKVL